MTNKWNKCSLCGGKVKRKLVKVSQEIEGRLVIVENVPAEVCTQCGEILYKPSTMRKLQKLVWSKPKPVRKVKVPVLDMKVSLSKV